MLSTEQVINASVVQPPPVDFSSNQSTLIAISTLFAKKTWSDTKQEGEVKLSTKVDFVGS